MTARATITVRPDPRSWSISGSHADRHSTARAELGLGTSKPIVMSGHQAGMWHPGIVAKLYAGLAFARSIDAAFAWIVVDNDNAPVDLLETPILGKDDEFDRRAISLSGRPEGSRPADPPFQAFFEQRHLAGSLFEPSIARVDQLVNAINRHDSEPNAAAAVTRGVLDVLGLPDVRVILASELAGSAAFRAFADRMRTDAEDMATAYNQAVRSVPDAGLTPLVTHPSRGQELPLWTLDDNGARRRVFSGDEIDESEQLLPRALTLTGFARVHLCDLFIHGTGGFTYDRATERWLESWGGADLSPQTLVTADLFPRPSGMRTVSGDEVAGARWRLHHTRHTPALLGDEQAQREKDALVKQIAGATDPVRRAELFARMHAMLERVRTEHAPELHAIETHTAAIARDAAATRLINDRTWPFVWHDRDALDELRGDIDRFWAPAAVGPSESSLRPPATR